MSLRLAFRPEVEGDVERAFLWYEGLRPGLGLRFFAALEARYLDILEAPESHPAVQGPIRKASIRHFPYLIYYQVTEDVVVVLGVLHAARHPDTWRQRSPASL